jgi:hypothetical protein
MQVLLGRDDELCHLYEQSDACQLLMDEGTTLADGLFDSWLPCCTVFHGVTYALL